MAREGNGGEARDILAGCGKGGATKGETEREYERRARGGGRDDIYKTQGHTSAIV